MHEGHGAADYVFCPQCATPLEWSERGGRLRQVCPQCGFVHWRNPGVGAAVVLLDEEGRILLVRRAPGATRAGLWSVPAGYVDWDEDVREAAARELAEETGLEVEVGDVVHVASNRHDPAKPTVGVWFAGTIVGGRLQAGDDADAVDWFPLDDLPELAFPTDIDFLRSLGEGAF